ncbi:MAG: hypothetical protein N2491_02885 [Negativicutes bacterium]|nr:hypothetical protein [Negativicutes bacterium]
MHFLKRIPALGVSILFAGLLLSACGMFTPAPKPEIGPAGKPVESKPNPPVIERFYSPPAEMYDLEALAGAIFEGIYKENWQPAEENLAQLQVTWQDVKTRVGNKKGVKEADEALEKLTEAVAAKKITASYEALNKFMGSVSDVGKSYKLSPVADVIGVSNSLRNVSFYVEEKNWIKAASKVKELEGVWNHAKPALEQVGILGEITKTHAKIKQLKDAVNAENKGVAEEHIASLNESLGYIRQFHRGK